MRPGDPARNNTGKMSEIRRDVQRDTVERNPASYSDSDRGDLVLGGFSSGAGWLVRPRDPDPDTILAPLAFDIEHIQCRDDPGFQCVDEPAKVGISAIKVEHHIGDTLAWPMIGELPAAAAFVNGKAGLKEVAGPGGSPSGVERGMFEEPDQFLGRASGNCVGAGFHETNGLFIRHETLRNPPFDREGGLPRQHEGRQFFARRHDAIIAAGAKMRIPSVNAAKKESRARGKASAKTKSDGFVSCQAPTGLATLAAIC